MTTTRNGSERENLPGKHLPAEIVGTIHNEYDAPFHLAEWNRPEKVRGGDAEDLL